MPICHTSTAPNCISHYATLVDLWNWKSTVWLPDGSLTARRVGLDEEWLAKIQAVLLARKPKLSFSPTGHREKCRSHRLQEQFYIRNAFSQEHQGIFRLGWLVLKYPSRLREARDTVSIGQSQTHINGARARYLPSRSEGRGGDLLGFLTQGRAPRGSHVRSANEQEQPPGSVASQPSKWDVNWQEAGSRQPARSVPAFQVTCMGSAPRNSRRALITSQGIHIIFHDVVGSNW